MSRSIAQRVASGIALLDAHGPADWRLDVDLSTLNMASTSHCVLGQVYGSFDRGYDDLVLEGGLDSDLPRDHGFDAPWFLTQYGMDRHYRLLTQAWRKALAPTPTED